MPKGIVNFQRTGTTLSSGWTLFQLSMATIRSLAFSHRLKVSRLKKSKSTISISGCFYASLLLKQGVPMKQIQEWLGHSDISTTANIYAHLDSQSKQLSAATMEQALPLPNKTPTNKW